MKLVTSPPKILFVDMEAKPGHWIGGDYVSKIITAIAWSWGKPRRIDVVTQYELSLLGMLVAFGAAYDEADIIVGHYIRAFDLTLLNHCREREGLPPAEPKLTYDTKLDRLKTHGGSNSQKNLAAQYLLKAPKVDVTLRQWEGFNDREPGYRDVVVERVVGDVKQNIQLFNAMSAAGYLGSPKRMDYGPGHGRRYTA